ncbi:MAG: 6,7-dimethyl-8-ribityLLumazine synthase [Bacteroidota bacterium]|jgi:6,7-dimethyl-8-ribityllumazine synthase
MNINDVTFADLGTATGKGVRIGIVAAAWHNDIVQELINGAVDTLHIHGVEGDHISLYRCPGTYEIPVVAATLIDHDAVDAVITLGVVIRGETAHFEYVASPVMHSLQELATQTCVPCIAGILTTENVQQAWDRAGGSAGHKGRESALAALHMVNLLRAIRTS